jgi:hypothetical protein
MTKLHLEEDGVMNPTGNEPKWPQFTAKASEMVSLYEYYGKPQGSLIGFKVYEIAVEDRVKIGFRVTESSQYPRVRTYPRTWLDKLDFIDQVHDGGAKSDKEIVNKIKNEYEENTKA